MKIVGPTFQANIERDKIEEPEEQRRVAQQHKTVSLG
jgi:hypothetical protein